MFNHSLLYVLPQRNKYLNTRLVSPLFLRFSQGGGVFRAQQPRTGENRCHASTPSFELYRRGTCTLQARAIYRVIPFLRESQNRSLRGDPFEAQVMIRGTEILAEDSLFYHHSVDDGSCFIDVGAIFLNEAIDDG